MNQIQSEILNLLLQDCRMSNAVIAKKIKRPRHVVSYNREQLKKQGIITGNRLIINYEALGYHEALIYLKIFQYSEVKEKVEGFIADHPNFKWGAEVFPSYNIRAVLVYKDVDELEKIVNEIEKLCQGKLLKKEILFSNGLIKKANFVVNEFPEKITKCQKIKLDEKEKKLFQALFDRPEERLLELSKKSGLSIESVRQKIEKFQKSGLIESFSTKPGKGKMGINFWGNLCLRVNNLDQHFNKLRSLLYSDTGYGMTRNVFGSWNIDMGTTVHSFEKLIEMKKNLEKLCGADFEEFEIVHNLRKFLNHKIPEIVFSE